MNYKSLPQGSMLWSFESEANFKALFGDEWELVDSGTAGDGVLLEGTDERNWAAVLRRDRLTAPGLTVQKAQCRWSPPCRGQ